MKKLSILFLTCFFAVSATASAQLITPDDVPMPVASPTISPTFNDAFFSKLVSDYDPALAWAFENGILTGDGMTGDLREIDCVKRAEILKMLYKVLEVDINNSNSDLFSDTFSNEWYAPYVRTAIQRNTIAGYPDGTFKPAQCVNRVEALKMTLLEFPNINPVNTPFTGINDVPVGEWYYPYASYALGNDLVGLKHTGFSSMYYPGEPMTREEFAEMLYRLKTLQDNNLVSFDSAYGPENFVEQPFEYHNFKPQAFFPYDTSVLITLDTSDDNQINIINRFLSNSPARTVDGFVKLMFEELANESSSDLLTAFGDNFKIMFATSESSSYIPRSTLLVTVNEPKKLTDLFDKLAASPDYYKSTLFGFNTFTSPENGIYFAYIDNALVVWQSFSDRYLALQEIKNGELNLLDNADYTQYSGSLPTPNVGSIYFSVPTGENGIFGIVASVGGLNLHYRYNGYEAGGNEASYMYKSLPGNDVLLYGENFGMLDILESTGADVVGELEDEGIELSAANWLNQGYAFLMQDTGNLISGMSLYFDAFGYVPQAEEDLAVFDDFITEMIDEAHTSSPETVGVLVKDTANVDGSTLDRVTLDFSKLPQEDLQEFGPFADFFLTPLEFYYGVTSDSYVVFALYSGFDDVYGQVPSISENMDVKEGMGLLQDYPNGLSYMSLGNFVDYIDMIVVELEKSEPMPTDVKDVYNDILDYLAPIKYVIGGEKDFGEYGSGLLFVKID